MAGSVASLCEALAGYAPKVGPSVMCGDAKLTVYEMCSGAEAELQSIVAEACKSRKCDGCGKRLDEGSQLNVTWDMPSAPGAPMKLSNTQVLCSACYPLTNLAAMSKDLSLRNTEEEVKARMAHFLQVNGHGTEASTAQTVSLVHECYAIAYSLRVSLRGYPPKFADENGKELNAASLLKKLRSTLVKAPEKRKSDKDADAASEKTPAKKAKKAQAKTPAPAAAQKAEAKNRRRTMG